MGEQRLKSNNASNNDYDYSHLLSDSNRIWKQSVLPHKSARPPHDNKDYQYINMCMQGKHEEEYLRLGILCFDVLNIGLEFDKNNVCELRINKVYSKP